VLPVHIRGLQVWPVHIRGLQVWPVHIRGLQVWPVHIRGLQVWPVHIRGPQAWPFTSGDCRCGQLQRLLTWRDSAACQMCSFQACVLRTCYDYLWGCTGAVVQLRDDLVLCISQQMQAACTARSGHTFSCN
jgi:hypothetical protein